MQLASVSQEALVLANTKIIVIGCGDWQPIRNYLEITGFQGQIFADPTRKLYHALGMTAESLRQTPADVAKKSYIRSGLLSNVIRSIWSGPMKNPFLIGKQGKLSQLGGDFIFGPGVSTCPYIIINIERHIDRKPMFFCLSHATYTRSC